MPTVRLKYFSYHPAIWPRMIVEVTLDGKPGSLVELDLYAGGGHGFVVRPGKSAPVDQWIDRFEEWLMERKLVAAK